MYRVEATIQYFEYLIQLYWKLFKHLLGAAGTAVASPQNAWLEAYQAGWIEDQDVWLQMSQDRNVTSHTYNEKLAN